MPCGMLSTASTRVSWASPPLEAAYAPICGNPKKQAYDPMFTIAPRDAALANALRSFGEITRQQEERQELKGDLSLFQRMFYSLPAHRREGLDRTCALLVFSHLFAFGL